MKVTRKNLIRQTINNQKAEREIKKRRIRRYSSNPTNTLCYADELNNNVNHPLTFSYADYNRNQGYIEVAKKHYDDFVRIHGVDLLYFRKYNTFFLEGKDNHANMVYGEDTTAEYYVSSYVRVYLNIEKQDFQFNMMGYESQEEVEIWVTIDDFRSRFATVVGEIKTDLFAVPVTADLINNEYYGTMDYPEFYAEIYGTMDEDELDRLYVTNVYPEIKERSMNSNFYKTLVRVEPLEPLTGTLGGQLTQMDDDYNYASGYLKGEISYHSLYNLENAPGWNIAPQVGDFFKLKVGELEEDYEIQQVMDKQLTNNNGLNALFGRYVFKCKAVRRAASEEEFKKADKEIGSDINDLFRKTDDAVFNTPEEENKAVFLQKDKKTKENNQNKKSNKMAKKIYNYDNNEDHIYGGYGNSGPMNLQDPITQKL